jgi:S1-C subfamily serine protease
MPTRNRIAARLLATAVIYGIAGFFGTGVAGAEPERAADGAITVRASGQTADAIGAGTIVSVAGSNVTIITAKHVAVFGSLTVTFADGNTAAGKILSLVRDRDLALVQAEVAPDVAAGLHAATIGRPQANLPVHVWGSGLNGPAYEPGAIKAIGRELPDGAAHNRYAVNCDLCHQGDSGAGVFNARGELVGIYVGFFVMENGRLSIAEEPLDGTALAAAGVPAATPAATIARANVPATPATPGSDMTTVAATFGGPAR